jgi:hypothetical protein
MGGTGHRYVKQLSQAVDGIVTVRDAIDSAYVQTHRIIFRGLDSEYKSSYVTLAIVTKMQHPLPPVRVQ